MGIFCLELGKKTYFLALGMGPNSGPKIGWSRALISYVDLTGSCVWTRMLYGKQCGSWSAGFFRSQLIKVYTVFNTVYIWYIVQQSKNWTKLSVFGTSKIFFGQVQYDHLLVRGLVSNLDISTPLACVLDSDLYIDIRHWPRGTTNFGRKIVNIFLSISLNFCFAYSKEPSHQDGSFEYPQHMLVEK